MRAAEKRLGARRQDHGWDQIAVSGFCIQLEELAPSSKFRASFIVSDRGET